MLAGSAMTVQLSFVCFCDVDLWAVVLRQRRGEGVFSPVRLRLLVASAVERIARAVQIALYLKWAPHYLLQRRQAPIRGAQVFTVTRS